MSVKLFTLLLSALLVLAGCSPRAAPPATPEPVPSPTASPAASPAPTAKPLSTPTPSGTPRPRLFVVLTIGLTTIQVGTKETATADTMPGSLCALSVKGPTGALVPGLFSRPVSSDGKATWDWTVSANAIGGAYHATATCVLGPDKTTGTATFQVFSQA